MQQPKNKKQNQKQQDYQDDEQQVKQIGADNQQKVTKKKKKKKKHKRRHPPQYYEQRKVEKQNLKREKQWNDRFMVGSGLQQENNSKTRLRLKSLKRGSQTKIKSDAYNTFNTESQNKSKPSKSFNIRIMTKKQDDGPKKQNSQNIKVQKSNSQNKQKNTQNIEGSKIEEKNQKIYKTQKSQNLHRKQHQQMQNLIQLVEEAHNQIKFPDSHKDILIQIIKKSNKKIIKSFIHAEIARLKSKTSCITNLESVLNKRQNMMIQFKQSQDNITDQKVTKYRVLTLRVIQQILKWKQQLQTSYLEQTGIKSKLCFKYMEQNYLLTICKDLNQKGLFLDLKSDPFLLGHGAKIIQQQLLIKIRACQMLLLQQQMDSY